MRTDSRLYSSIPREEDSPEWVTKLPAAREAGQMVIVAGTGMDRTTAWISMHRKDGNGRWKQMLSTPGFVGRNGLCADAERREGCGKTPIGVYRFNRAFGTAPDPGCALPYIRADSNIYWSGDPGRQYNRMADIREVPDLATDVSERIADNPCAYRYCLNISFNEEGTPGRGFAIFLHCFGPRNPWTEGCVSIPEHMMKAVMRSVQEDCAVVIDTIENLDGTMMGN